MIDYIQKEFIDNGKIKDSNYIIWELIWFSGCGYIKQTNIESKDIAFSEERNDKYTK